MVGTYKARKVLYDQFRLARRSCGAGISEWAPLQKNGEWEVATKALWKYQFTRTPIEWTQELTDILYEESQGIADVAVKLFMLAQQKVILNRLNSDKEKIGPKVFRAVAKNELAVLRPILEALRKRDWDKLSKIDDVKLPSIEELLAHQQSSSIEVTQKEADSSSKETAGAKSQPDSVPAMDDSLPARFPSIPKGRIGLKPILTEVTRNTAYKCLPLACILVNLPATVDTSIHVMRLT